MVKHSLCKLQEDQISSARHHTDNRPQGPAPVIPALGRCRQTPAARWLASLAELVSSGVTERPRFKTKVLNDRRTHQLLTYGFHTHRKGHKQACTNTCSHSREHTHTPQKEGAVEGKVGHEEGRRETGRKNVLHSPALAFFPDDEIPAEFPE